MAQFDIGAMKTQIKNTLIANGWDKKEYDDNGNAVGTGVLTAETEVLVDAITDAFIVQFNIWKAAQVITSPVQVTPSTGTGATVPTPGSLP